MIVNLTSENIEDARINSMDYFPMGEFNVKLPDVEEDLDIFFQFPQDLFKIPLVVDAWKNLGKGNYVRLYIPYLPYARQDRICNQGEAFSSKVFCNFINECGFDRVIVLDPHSEDSIANLKRKQVIHQYLFARQAVDKFRPDYLIAPDKGSTEKLKFLAELVNLPIVQCLKTRDVNTGQFLGFEVPETLPSGKGLIVDDICDAGGTFLGLGKLLKDKGATLGLYVTHGGFTKGTSQLFSIFDNIYTTNSLRQSEQSDRQNKRVEIIDVWKPFAYTHNLEK